MKEKPVFLNNEKGSVLIIAVMILVLLTVIGISAITTSNIEVQISGNDKINKMVFYAADSGIPYVSVHTDWYGPDNLYEAGTYFSENPDEVVKKKYKLSDRLQVDIENVLYLGKNHMPLGSGFSAGQIFSINYKLRSNGTGPNNGKNTVEAGFYRIGL
jgi:hypothetical protein